jgi:hypothetical protein
MERRNADMKISYQRLVVSTVPLLLALGSLCVGMHSVFALDEDSPALRQEHQEKAARSQEQRMQQEAQEREERIMREKTGEMAAEAEERVSRTEAQERQEQAEVLRSEQEAKEKEEFARLQEKIVKEQEFTDTEKRFYQEYIARQKELLEADGKDAQMKAEQAKIQAEEERMRIEAEEKRTKK